MIFIRRLFSKKEKERTAEFAIIANNLGMSFSPKLDKTFRKQIKCFWRFQTERNRNRGLVFRNVLHKTENGVEIAFFECSPDGKRNVIGVMDGIFYFKSPTLDIPSFALHQMGSTVQTFLSMVGIKNINFISHPAFSDKYLLNGGDEQAVRDLFSETLLNFLVKLDGVNIEGCGDQLIIYRPGGDQDDFNRPFVERMEPDDFKKVLQDTIQIFEQFRS